MTRLADLYSSSDDELPQLEVLLRKINAGSATRPRDLASKSHERSPLLPKSSTKSSTRKVRRLGDRNLTPVNPLLLPWNEGDKDAARISPRKASRMSRQQNNGSRHSVSRCEQVLALPAGLTLGSRYQRDVLLRESVSSSDRVNASIALQDNIGRLRGRLEETIPDVGGLAMSGNNDNDEETQIGESQHTEVLEPKSEMQSKINASEVDESSLYQTADENSFEYSDGSTSDFELNHLSDEPLREASVKKFDISQQYRGTRSRAAMNEASKALKPRSTNRRSREPIHDSKGKTSPLRTSMQHGQATTKGVSSNSSPVITESNLTNSFEKLRIHHDGFSADAAPQKDGDLTTPPTTPPKKSHPGSLVSPRKLARIPQTPHRPSVDAFWSQDFVDDWNHQHSPRKLMLPVVAKSPAKDGPKKAARKSFEAKKHSLAEEFLRELDAEITQGRIAKLAESTGGVKLVWTKTLKTTAGRANWRRETTRTQQADGALASVSHKHHASIELAEKVIDDEDRLLNVLAHEFCHLANFMISGIKNNPHGKEFKAWASKCSLAFGTSRGIHVTTKHTYDIDFKYVWECTACGSQYKRHSKSIDPERHRCGSCKSALKQTKPMNRGGGARGGVGGKPSEYQLFVKEQMRIVRGENPGSPQKEVMRIVADKWARSKKTLSDSSKIEREKEASAIVTKTMSLTLDEDDECE